MPSDRVQGRPAKCAVGANSEYRTIAIHGGHHRAIKLVSLLGGTFCYQAVATIAVSLNNLYKPNLRFVEMGYDFIQEIGSRNMVRVHYYTKFTSGIL